jgi:hypothetical protein
MANPGGGGPWGWRTVTTFTVQRKDFFSHICTQQVVLNGVISCCRLGFVDLRADVSRTRITSRFGYAAAGALFAGIDDDAAAAVRGDGVVGAGTADTAP